jgi:hypothetical protein
MSGKKGKMKFFFSFGCTQTLCGLGAGPQNFSAACEKLENEDSAPKTSICQGTKTFS